MSPEYQRAMGGSHGGAVVAASICPTTRPRNSTSRTAMTTAYARALGKWRTSGALTAGYAAPRRAPAAIRSAASAESRLMLYNPPVES